MKEKGRHSSESGNPGYLKEARLPEITRYFSLKVPAWMRVCAGMTNYDTVSWREGMKGRRKNPSIRPKINSLDWAKVLMVDSPQLKPQRPSLLGGYAAPGKSSVKIILLLIADG